MGSKHKRQAEARPSPAGDGPRGEVLRLIERGHLKDAVKQAKILYKEDGSPENHRLLERAYLLRAEQLQQSSMPTSAREVAQHLFDFGVTDPELTEPAVQLLIAVGLSAQAQRLGGRLESPGAQERLLNSSADVAVLHPERASPEDRADAAPVRAALEALADGDAPGALDGLRAIPRSSPLADWKVFARGLAAYRRRDLDEMRANWDRLEPGRAAARIAATLRTLAEPTPGDALAPAPGLDVLERRALGEPILGRLRELRDHAAQGRWAEAIRMLSGLRASLRRVDPALPERLTRVLYVPLLRASTKEGYRQGTRMLKQFAASAEPTALDPKWNRLWALAWEGEQGSLEDAEGYWKKYLDDLETRVNLPPAERDLARALVWKHLGEQYVDEADADDGFGPFAPDPRARKRDRDRAVKCLTESLKICPTHRPTHVELYKAYESWGQPEKAAEAARGLLAVFPDDLDTLVFLANHHFREDRPFEALEYVRRARALKPLDGPLADLEWSVHVASARHHAKKRRWAAGRAEFDVADRIKPEDRDSYTYLVRRALFEIKASDVELGEQLIEQAKSRLSEPAPAWLSLQIEATRYGLAKLAKERFAPELASALKAKPTSETAGEVAGLLAAYLISGIKYTGRPAHIKQVVQYLRGATRLKFRALDLRKVGLLLEHLPKPEPKLTETLTDLGLKQFPDDPYFALRSAELELNKGPYRGRPWIARERLERAIETAQASADPADAALLPRIKDRLTLIAEIDEGPLRGLPFRGRGAGPMPPPELFDMFMDMARGQGIDPDDIFDDLDEDDFEDDEGGLDEPADTAPRPRRPRLPTRRQKHKK